MKCKTVVWFKAGGVHDKPQWSITVTTLMKKKKNGGKHGV